MATLRTVTVKSSGGDYTTLSAAEAGEQADLVSLDRRLDIECHAFNDTTACTISGYTTDATRYIRVYAADDHGGTWNTGVYRLSSTSSNALVVAVDRTIIQGLQVEMAYTGSANRSNVQFTALASSGVGWLEKCLFRRTASPSAGTHSAVFVDDSDWFVRMSNCIAWWETTNLTGSIAWRVASNCNLLAYNCTAYGFDIGHNQAGSGSVLAINCIVAATTTGFSGSFGSSNYNASTDATAPGANSRQSQTFTFVNAGAFDLHLSGSDAGAKGYGTDLSSDGIYPFSVDVDGDTRTGAWDIGADQVTVVSSSGAVRLINSVPLKSLTGTLI